MKSIIILVLIFLISFKLIGQTALYNYSTSPVQGTEYVGGLMGFSPVDTALVTNSYARGAVEGIRYVGGFIGSNHGKIINSYSTGQVAGSDDFGGFAGQNSGIIENSYWDITSSGSSFSDGGEGRLTENMTYPNYLDTYTGWDFDAVWSHDLLNENDGYPLLQSVEVNQIQTRVFPPSAAVSSGDGYYPLGTQIEVSVENHGDYVFQGWFENGELLNNNLSFTYQVDGHATLIARFRVRNNHQLTLEAFPDAAGTVLGEGTYLEGEEVEVVAIPAENHRFVHWQNEENDAVSTDSVYLFTMPATDLILYALFEEVTSVSDLFDYRVLLYPNPATDYLVLEFHETHKKMEISVYNLNGQLVNQKLVYNTQKTDINLPFSEGIYLISICINDEIITDYKVFITH